VPAKPIFHELLTTLDQGFIQGIPASTHQPLTLHHTIPLDLSGDLYALLHPTNRLIYSPSMIDTTLLQPFVEGAKEVMIVFTQNGRTLSATLPAVHSNYLIADTQHSVFRRQRGDLVLVVFPIAPQQHYVLQTSIYKVYAFRLELAYCDPRYDVRHAIPLAAPVLLQRVPTTLLTAIEQQQGHMVRHITLTSRDAHGIVRSVIADLFCPTDAAQPAASPYAADQIIPCTLRDLSLSGACLTVGPTSSPDALAHRLVQLTIPLPSVSQSMPEWSCVSLTLQLLGVVRGISHASSTRTLHIRFLKRLFPEIDALLWHLEGGFLDQHTPLS